MSQRRYRVLYIASHPVQYMGPVFRLMAVHPRLDLQVAYCTLRGAEEGYDPEFGMNVKWDVPLLEGFRWIHVPNKGSGNESFFGLTNPGLWRLIRDGKFDVVVCFTGYIRASFWIARLRAWLSGAAFVFGTDATSLESMGGQKWKPPVKRLFWPLLYRLATQVIVPSDGSKDLMLSLGIHPDRVTVTPYSVDNDWWRDQSLKVDRRSVRSSWNVPPESPVILFCAKLQPWKRPQDLLRAFAHAEIEDSYLIFAGEGPLRAQLEKEAEELRVAEQTRFLGFMNQSQLPSVYASSDILVLPSSYDAFGVVVNEASICGCVVVASDRVGAARNLIAPIDPSLIYTCGDVAQLTVILRGLLQDRDRRRRLSRAVTAHMSSWSPEANVAAFVEALDSVSRRSAGGARPTRQL